MLIEFFLFLLLLLCWVRQRKVKLLFRNALFIYIYKKNNITVPILIWQFPVRLITQAIKQHESRSGNQADFSRPFAISPSFAGINERLVRSHSPQKRNAIIKMGRGWLTQSHSRSPSFDLCPGIVPLFTEIPALLFSPLHRSLRASRSLVGIT